MKLNLCNRFIIVAQNSMSPGYSLTLADELERNTSLASLDISDQYISRNSYCYKDNCIKTIVCGLQYSNILLELDVSKNTIDLEDARAIAEAINKNCTLRVLHLS